MTDLIRPLPDHSQDLAGWEWERYEPYYERLRAVELTQANVHAWLADWTQLASLVDERYNRLSVAITQDTTDKAMEGQYNYFVESIYPRYQAAEQTLKQKLIASGIEPAGFQVPLRNMRAEAALFREENLPLITREQMLEKEFDRIIGAQTVVWEGEERTLTQMLPVFQSHDRATRERAWRLVTARRLEDRAALDDLWIRMLDVRLQLAKNAGYELGDGTGDYRAFRWQQFLRFDYTPDDCKGFAKAIAEAVVPAASRIYERYRAQLDVDSLRPWDLAGPQGFYTIPPPPNTEPLRPFANAEELAARCADIFDAIDPELGALFDVMRRENLLDLPNRKGKAPGGYCTGFEHTRRPFIFMNTVGTQEDVQTLLHESGHAFHAFEAFALPYIQQHAVPLEFCEVASMSMEFLGIPYLDRPGGFYNSAEALRARAEKLETAIFFWPYMAVVDLFQHWVYENPHAAREPRNCDARWTELWNRFMPGVDWSGLEEELQTGWHRKLHILTSPFYYVEYGMAQLGAAQVWANALRDQPTAVRAYRDALALGGTATLPELYARAGARFQFDAPILREAVELMESFLPE